MAVLGLLFSEGLTVLSTPASMSMLTAVSHYRPTTGVFWRVVLK